MRVEIFHELGQLPGVGDDEVRGLAAFFGREAACLVAAVEAGQVRGWLPFTRVREAALGLEALRLTRASSLHGRVDDRTALPMLEHLLHAEPASLVELGAEAGRGPLARAALGVAGLRFVARLSPGPARATVALGGDLGDWFHALGGWAAPLARRTRSLWAAGALEVLASDGPRAVWELLPLYLELKARSARSGPWPAAGFSDPARAGRREALAGAGLLLLSLLVLDGLPIAGSLSLVVGDRVAQLEAAWDPAFEDTAPHEVLCMFEVRRALGRGVRALELCAELTARHARLGAVALETEQVQLYRRLGPHHLAALGRRSRPPAAPPAPERTTRSDLADQLRARTHAAEALARLDAAGLAVERLAGAELETALPFEVRSPEHERVRRAV